MRRGWDHLDITARRVRMNCYYVWFQYVPILPVSFLMTPVELKCRNVRPMRYAPVVGNFWKTSKRSTLWTLMDSTDSKIDVWLLVDVIYLSHFIAYAVCHQVNLMRIVVFHAEFRLEIAFFTQRLVKYDAVGPVWGKTATWQASTGPVFRLHALDFANLTRFSDSAS